MLNHIDPIKLYLELIDESIDRQKLCDSVSTLVDDLYTYANYDKIALELLSHDIPMEESKEFYGKRILDTIELAFYNKSKDEIEIAVSGIITE